MKCGADSPEIGNSLGSLCRVVEDADPYRLASQSLRGAQKIQIRFSSDMCGGKTPSGERDARPSRRPSGA